MRGIESRRFLITSQAEFALSLTVSDRWMEILDPGHSANTHTVVIAVGGQGCFCGGCQCPMDCRTLPLPPLVWFRASAVPKTCVPSFAVVSRGPNGRIFWLPSCVERARSKLFLLNIQCWRLCLVGLTPTGCQVPTRPLKSHSSAGQGGERR